jgi:hypothetical protein
MHSPNGSRLSSKCKAPFESIHNTSRFILQFLQYSSCICSLSFRFILHNFIKHRSVMSRLFFGMMGKTMVLNRNFVNFLLTTFCLFENAGIQLWLGLFRVSFSCLSHSFATDLSFECIFLFFLLGF